MPRKAFIADVLAASKEPVPRIGGVVRGDDDGDVNFVFSPCSDGPPMELSAVALDVSGYPAGNTWMIFARSSDLPKGVEAVLGDLASFSAGSTVTELLSTVSARLQKVLATGAQEDPFSIEDSSDLEMGDGDEEDESEADEYLDEYSDFEDGPRTTNTTNYRCAPQNAAKLNRRIKEDLRAVRFAGFKLGILSGLTADSRTSVLSVSIQASKLGLSEEALQAWDLELNQYVVLLIRYSDGYKSFETLISEPAKSQDVQFRIGVSNKYKPTIIEALAAFTDITKNANKTANDQKLEGAEQSSETAAGFSSLFISSSLNDFINNQFISLLKIRYGMSIGWDGAKRYFNDKQGRIGDHKALLATEYGDEPESSSSLPPIIAADHITESGSKILSFPLVAAQFSMRYLLRCTEFCLVCHDKIEEGFEALKPYVCSKPLCLYQYMSLGFGPSVEHEIITQPYVVDLLVSFCYTAATARRLREYPTGMSLFVPPITRFVTTAHRNSYAYSVHAPTTEAATGAPVIPTSAIEVRYDVGRHEIVFLDSAAPLPVHKGDWVVMTIAGQGAVHHRVEDTSLYPTVKLSDVGVTQKSAYAPTLGTAAVPATPATTPPPLTLVPATMMKYDQMFDDMDDVGKAESIVMLLETLPTIKEFRSYLVRQARSSEPSLRTWKERVSPAALGILRWIIASNRSCIVQVDICPGQTESEVAKAKIRLDQKCSNVNEAYVQFRFAQGAPDKEQRFLNALKSQGANLDPKYPTMFAWHGSPLANWHSIIRHGLDFKETLHGRAFGHGVYHAQDQNTSVGYAQMNGDGNWPGSSLSINSAMSLNEIVNCPSQFASNNPYLVVQHIDWIQCRYLFVQTSGDQAKNNQRSKLIPPACVELEQDPTRTATTTLHKPVGIPQSAVSVSRAFRASNALDTSVTVGRAKSPTKKKTKHSTSGSKLDLIEASMMSDEEEMEDIMFLFSDTEEPTDKGKGKTTEVVVPKFAPPPQTDFVPESLDQSTLPMLEPPSYATPSATMRLNRELKTILKTQNSTPLHELGWYINPELVSNVYQWIVELHSFESSLPLAKDMKAAGFTSIVLEIRFGKDYPMSPPFVRVIRPRFLPFMSGGGGHVTGGGAMCMELLTNNGWSAVSSIESVLLQVRIAIMNFEPKPARLESQSKVQQRDYGTAEAMDAYIRACRAHGWNVPKDFQDFAGGAGPSY